MLQDLDRGLFALCCGSGRVADVLSRIGCDVMGIDLSIEGITEIHSRYFNLKLFLGSVYDDLRAKYGEFPVVTSLKVVGYVYFLRKYASTLFELVELGGAAIISTTHHVYKKSLVMELTGKWMVISQRFGI